MENHVVKTADIKGKINNLLEIISRASTHSESDKYRTEFNQLALDLSRQISFIGRNLDPFVLELFCGFLDKLSLLIEDINRQSHQLREDLFDALPEDD